MKIAHVVTRMQRSGSERNIAHFANWQIEHGHEVVVICGSRPDVSLLPRAANVAVIPDLLRQLSPRHDRKALVALRELLESERCDVVHTHQSKAGTLGRLIHHPEGRVVMHTVHMPSFGPVYGRQSAALESIERRCARRTDLIVTVGQELRDLYLSAGIGSASMYRVLRSPIDLDTFTTVRTASGARRRAARRSLGIDPWLPTILAVGALEARKRHDLAISAARSLLETGQAQLLVAGEGPERSNLERHARQLGIRRDVHLVGHLDDVTTAFLAADAMVHTSATEGVPQVVLQSLAAGVPAVTTPVEGIKEIGAAGTVIADPDVTSLADHLRSTLREPPALCDLETLTPWRTSHVEATIARLHMELEALLQSGAPDEGGGA